MMKKGILFFLTLLLCLSIAVPALASPRNGVYILDEQEHLDADAYASLHQRAMVLSETLEIDILTVFTYETDLVSYGKELLLGQYDDQIMMLDNGSDWELVLHGDAQRLLSEDDISCLWEVYTQESTYIAGIEAYYSAVEGILAEKAENLEDNAGYGTRVVDQADLLTDFEEVSLREKLDEISLRQKLDVVVVTADTLDGKSPQNYADDFYDFNGYGQGPGYDGILLLVSMEDRDYWISTCGYGITAFTDAGIEYLAEEFLSDLRVGDYAEAFEIYADTCDAMITLARKGNPFDVDDLPKEPFDLFGAVFSSTALGFIVAFIVTGVMRAKLKSVRSQSGAADYVKKDSLNVTKRQDLFLYKNVSRREKPKSSGSSSGGSSTHRSSSGRSHGGGGGKF